MYDDLSHLTHVAALHNHQAPLPPNKKKKKRKEKKKKEKRKENRKKEKGQKIFRFTPPLIRSVLKLTPFVQPTQTYTGANTSEPL